MQELPGEIVWSIDLLGNITETIVQALAVGCAEIVSATGGPLGGLGTEGCGGHETTPGVRTVTVRAVVVQAQVVAQLVRHRGRHLVQVVTVPH